jgi:HSP20 family molecular chaperone IbpA
MLTRYWHQPLRNLSLFDDFLTDSVDPSFGYHIQDDGRLQVQLDLPGVKKEDLQLTHESNRIYVRGKRGQRSIEKTIAINDKFDPLTSYAQLIDGVLTITMDQKADSTHTIKIN